MTKLLARYFRFDTYSTSTRQELMAGITTFLTMAYIIFVNPNVLAAAGMDRGAVFVATCLVTTLGSILIGWLSKYPFALAPGMALNVYFSYVVVEGAGLNWQNALGAVFIASILFLMISLTKIREWIISSIPECLNTAITLGLGLFIALIALKSAGIVTINKKTILQLGHINLSQGLFALGFLIIVVLDYYQVYGAIVFGILVTTVLSLLFGLAHYEGIMSLPPSLMPTFSKMAFDQLDKLKGISVIFSILLVALFDCAGTLMGLIQQNQQLKKHRSVQRISRGLLADSIAGIIGAVFGTASPSPYLESAAGIRAGGRTGLTAWTVAFLFLFALFLSPLAATIPSFATGPALLFVACTMMKNVTDINWSDITETIPSALTALMIPYTSSVANGVGIGIISFTLIKIICKKTDQVSPIMIALSLIFGFYFLMQTTVTSL